jgi:LPXTG-site transpeptidase (sortase) family protein
MSGNNMPIGTNELYGFLGVDGHGHGHDDVHGVHHEDPGQETALPHEGEHTIIELPTHKEESMNLKIDIGQRETPTGEKRPLIEHDYDNNRYSLNISSALHNLTPKSIFKNGWPYVVIFIVGIFLFLVLFTNFSVSNLFHATKNPTSQADKASTPESTIPANQLAAYKTWISSYYFEVGDPSILDPNRDLSGNGLTNYQKFLLNLNPKKTDTMGLGISDTEALIMGINPLTGGALTDEQKQIIASNVDLEAISNKMSLASANSMPRVAGANTTAGDTFRQEAVVDISKGGEVEIPSLNIKVPIVWTRDTADFDKDLQKGVVHYPGTPLPGELGTSYISGHSSNYSWAKGSYNKIFDTLGNLKVYDSFMIHATDINGKPVTFHYIVAASQIYKADDQAQFANIGKSTVALSTCWPIGTSQKRLVVFGHLSQVSKSN